MDAIIDGRALARTTRREPTLSFMDRSHGLRGAPVVAIFDDDIAYIRAVERMLRLGGFASCPITTFDVDEAARVIAEAGCRAVLVDIFLYDEPRGFSCIERLRAVEATANLPLVVTSGAHREIQRMAPFLAAHRCELLEKPFGPDELLAKLRFVTSQPMDPRPSLTGLPRYRAPGESLLQV